MERPEYERRKMHNSPRNHVAIAMEVAFALGCCSQQLRDITRDRWFLGEYCNRTGF